MAIKVTLNGVEYYIPELTEEEPSVWASLTSYLVALGSNNLTSGSITLGQDFTFSGGFGLSSAYYKGVNPNPATTGLFRLSTSDFIGWRNQQDTANLSLSVTSDDRLAFNGTKLATVNETQGGSVTTTQGDLIVRGSTEDVRLPRGNNNQVLTTTGNDLSWQDPQAVSSSTPTTTRGDFIVRGASTDTRLPLGSANTILFSDGTDPIWFNPIADITNLSADYTVQDNDGIHKFIYSLASGDKALTLPNPANKLGRELIAVVADDSANKLTLVGDVDGNGDFSLSGEGSSVTLIATAQGWKTTSWQGYQSTNQSISLPQFFLPSGASLNSSNLKMTGDTVAIKGTGKYMNCIRFHVGDVTLSGAATSSEISFESGGVIEIPNNSSLFLDSSINSADNVVIGGFAERDANTSRIKLTFKHDSSVTFKIAGSVTFITASKPSWG